ncbi:glycosyltransferase family 4 protein [Teratosphaeria destructans]|uniref:GDP-Man:Man(3)GlcNAc(2)-PP-Dol alpha-1,2-mannosyltransferase n=1 Tax=Teratosphaeria destructans TaxID=418781 RepID=A0A9W7SW59_9PEZI|nr:glycosyltransferase family 4 protein [Teratosphaeria destructans]
MAWPLSVAALLLGLAATLGLSPHLFRFIGRQWGSAIRSRSQQRRELLLTRAAAEEAEEEEARRKGGLHSPDPGKLAGSSSASLDEEWEKVDQGAKAPTAPQSKTTGGKSDDDYAGVIAFFHPFCNAGGGGERVLWAAILATQARYPRALCVVYTGDHDASKEMILGNVKTRFNIHLAPSRIAFLYLSSREYVLASKWPHFTLLGQSIGSLILGWEAFALLAPDIYIDTMGYAFTSALSKWLFPSVPTASYVHYPTISTDMLSSLHSEITSGQGLNAGLGKGIKGKVKQLYWEYFAKLYSWVGGSVDVVMTNSSWTQNHIQALWQKSRTSRGKKRDISVLYPPCPVEELADKIPVDSTSEKQRTRNILYIAQFRPEKMHDTIISAFHTFLKTYQQLWDPSSGRPSKPNLILVGSVRDDHDEKRVYKLRLQAQEIKENVQFVINAKWDQILDFLKTSSVGVNGMWNEHFGIGVVEYQAAGLIPVVNDSGGPKHDIVVPIDGEPTGFHASTPQAFADGFAQALSLDEAAALRLRLRARESSWRFSEEVFRAGWLREMEALVRLTGMKG